MELVIKWLFFALFRLILRLTPFFLCGVFSLKFQMFETWVVKLGLTLL